MSVVDSAGAKIANAIVRVGSRPLRNAFVNFQAVKNAGLDGKAVFSKLPEGPYEVCVQMPGTNLVDSCEWEARGFQTYLQSGATANVHLTMKTGTKVTVTVDDAGGFLGKKAFLGQKLRLSLATKDSHFIPMMAVKNAHGRQFSALVPADTDLRVKVHSTDFQVTDAAGKFLDLKSVASYISIHSNTAPAGGLAAAQSAPLAVALRVVGLQ